jgi:acetyl esterase/lipase
MLLANSTHEVLSQATEMAAALRGAHVLFQLLEIPGTAHGFYYLLSRIPGSGDTVLETTIAFLRAPLGETRSPAPAPPAGRGPGPL